MFFFVGVGNIPTIWRVLILGASAIQRKSHNTGDTQYAMLARKVREKQDDSLCVRVCLGKQGLVEGVLCGFVGLLESVFALGEAERADTRESIKDECGQLGACGDVQSGAVFAPPRGSRSEMMKEDPRIVGNTRQARTIRDPTVEISASIDADRLEHQRKGARGLDGSDQIALLEQSGLAHLEVVHRQGERDTTGGKGVCR